MPNRAFIKSAWLAGAAVGAIALGAVEAQAGGFFIHEQSAYFQGLSFAGVAAGGPSLSAMFWNPATITQQGPGLSFEGDFTVAWTHSEITPSAAATVTGVNLLPFGSSGNIGGGPFIPASYLVYGLTDRISLGLALNAPFAEQTRPSQIWAGMFYSRQSAVVSLNANPDIAFKVTDWLSVGAGAQIQWFKTRLYSAFPGSGTGVPDTLSIDADGWDAGFTAGITLTPTPWTTIGAGYRSQIDQKIDGHIFRPSFLTTVVIPGIGPIPITVPSGFTNFDATIPLPGVATASIRQKVTDTLTLLGTVEWTNWSRLGTVPVTSNPAGILGVPTTFAFGWRDGWLVSAGAEYQWSPLWAVRAGIGWEQSPVNDQVRGTRLPDSDRIWLSAGASYKWNEQLAFDFGYSHIFFANAPINLVPGNPTFDAAGGLLGTFIGSAHTQSDILSVALRYRMVPPPPPLVTKG